MCSSNSGVPYSARTIVYGRSLVSVKTLARYTPMIPWLKSVKPPSSQIETISDAYPATSIPVVSARTVRAAAASVES